MKTLVQIPDRIDTERALYSLVSQLYEVGIDLIEISIPSRDFSAITQKYTGRPGLPGATGVLTYCSPFGDVGLRAISGDIYRMTFDNEAVDTGSGFYVNENRSEDLNLWLDDHNATVSPTGKILFNDPADAAMFKLKFA